MSGLLSLGEAVAAHAARTPQRAAAADLSRTLTFADWNARANRLANALRDGLGLEPGDRVGVLAYNRLEWLEVYLGLARAGLVAVPINFRLVAHEVAFILADAGAKALIVQDELAEVAGPALEGSAVTTICLGHCTMKDAHSYEDLLSRASPAAPAGPAPGVDEGWALMYTSGTTGRPKGALQSHQSAAAIALVTALDFGFQASDRPLLVMPMCHANSLYFFATFAYLGACVTVLDRRSFDPEELLRTLTEREISFTSLVPTHYIAMLGVETAPLRTSRQRKFLISSASARRDTKLAILERFPGSSLFELYGSTEAGWVTILRPEEQLDHLGTVGREFTGTDRVRLLDEAGAEVPDGEVGELYSRTPYTFSRYWNLADRTAEALRDGWCTVGDVARRHPDGFIQLVDRKRNMIITGGENVYPSDVEGVLGAHPAVKDVAVIGVPDDRWGEAVHAVVVLASGRQLSEAELVEWSRGRIAGYKRPRGVTFVSDAEMPRTATGKILHRALRERLVSASVTADEPESR